MDLRNQKVVIVGGTSGVGLATARAAAAAGATVVVASSSREKVDQAKADLGGPAEGFTVDVTDEASVESLFGRVGESDHLVLTPGNPIKQEAFLDADLSYVRPYFDVKFWGQYLCVRHGARRVKNGGSVTLTSGGGGPARGVSTMACVNGAVEALARTLAIELAPVRVNVVRMGVIDTGLWRNYPEEERRKVYDAVAQGTLVGRLGWPEEVAQAYLYLMTSGYTTGTDITIDGGNA